jgi:hypothetical protein
MPSFAELIQRSSGHTRLFYGARPAFTFADRGSYLESVDEMPRPHEFIARVSLGHGGHIRRDAAVACSRPRCD